MNLENFEKKKEFLICVDSDGCAMDTMDLKHIRCFGPCLTEEWGLEEWKEPILKRWNEINLYSMTRGINRFKGLAKMLREIQEKYTDIEDLDSLEKWVEESPELSNAALAQAIRNGGGISLQKALSWSVRVNQKIDNLPFNVKRPFEGVKEALEYAHEKADIAVVSSANLQAVKEEWDIYGLTKHVDILLSQEAGSKAFCIGELMKKGYDKSKILMAGDAPGDYEAAVKNGVLFYPIFVRREKKSWEEFLSDGFLRLMDGSYEGAYQEEKAAEFWENLKDS
ncbi:MAG: HAD family hydrolase [Faecalicatena sp.]|uniref:HAD family hydrolase n=1 Tax=Faecalicatena sp. TaxID=2005360 RepID=UPI0025833035|nr:HAD hydrolase-like protein [Faecalicatena sp.]MCI6465575.1 HAD family hydrolase [Faecalicatena sp.]MDY5617407.1 HAD hydrolase-like protein [Lachnospiraceae bacterium]